MTEAATKLHDEAIVIDATCPAGHWRAHRDDWIAGGTTACGLSVGEFHVGGHRGAYDFLYDLADIYRIVRETPGLRLAISAADIRAAKADSELAVILCFQGTEAIEYEPWLLEGYWRMGVRIIQLAYNRRNPLCDGCMESSDAGLSVLGRRVIAEMNRLGILVDVSHTGVRSALEAIEASSAPCIASHSNAAAVHANRRNLPDEVIRAIAESGGVIGVNGFASFVAAGGRPTLDQFIDHIVYIDSLVGPGHVGLGLDYALVDFTDPPTDEYLGAWEAQVASHPELFAQDVTGPPPYHYPEGLEGPDRLPALTARLLERGYEEDAVRGILGDNWLRIYNQVWTQGANR